MNRSMSWGRNVVQSFIMSFTEWGVFCSYGLFSNPIFQNKCGHLCAHFIKLMGAKILWNGWWPGFLRPFQGLSLLHECCCLTVKSCSSEPAQINPLDALKRSSQMWNTSAEDRLG